MAARPEITPGVPNYFEWASADSIQVVSANNQIYVLNNKEAVLPEFESFGLRYGQPLTFQEINFQFDSISKMLQHLEERDYIGSIRRTTVNESAIDISERYGGTWEQIGTETVASTTVYIWEKTA